jgi:hypothetical protein
LSTRRWREAGTLSGDRRPLSFFAPDGIRPRPLREDETKQLRLEVMRNIDHQRIPVKFGNGGGRKLVLFSAVACPPASGSRTSWSRSGKDQHHPVRGQPAPAQQQTGKINTGGLLKKLFKR